MEKAKILIVEDDSIVAMDIESSLKKLGYSVSGTVSHGERAVEKVEELKPDLVLMDIVLKGEMDGIEAAEAIRSRFNTPVVFVTAYADESMVQAVLRNLLSNALKFTSAGGTVTIAAQSFDDRYIEIAVSDTGVGVPPDILPRLLRLDSQYTHTGTAGEEGSGLGLILCKELVEQNKGTISVESEVGKGTTFRVTLPKTVDE